MDILRIFELSLKKDLTICKKYAIDKCTKRRSWIWLLVMQTRKYSLAESITNIVLGSIINILLLQAGNLFGWWDVPLIANFAITIGMTIISFIRQYVVRRSFNRITVRNHNQANYNQKGEKNVS